MGSTGSAAGLICGLACVGLAVEGAGRVFDEGVNVGSGDGVVVEEVAGREGRAAGGVAEDSGWAVGFGFGVALRRGRDGGVSRLTFVEVDVDGVARGLA